MGTPANMRLSALTDELVLPDSINEIVAFHSGFFCKRTLRKLKTQMHHA